MLSAKEICLVIKYPIYRKQKKTKWTSNLGLSRICQTPPLFSYLGMTSLVCTNLLHLLTCIGALYHEIPHVKLYMLVKEQPWKTPGGQVMTQKLFRMFCIENLESLLIYIVAHVLIFYSENQFVSRPGTCSSFRVPLRSPRPRRR